MVQTEIRRLVEVIRDNGGIEGDWKAALAAAKEFNRVATTDDLPYLRSELSDCGTGEGYLASTICIKLCEIGNADDLPLLIEALHRHHGREFHRDAIWEGMPAIVARDPSGATPHILRLMTSGNEAQRAEAIFLYPHTRPLLPAEPLLEIARNGPQRLRYEALHVIGTYRDHPEVRPILIAALADPADEVVRIAIEQLGCYGSPDDLPHLRRFLQHASDDIRQTARQAIRRLGSTEM